MLIDGLYILISKQSTEKGFLAKIQLDRNHSLFKGHFPGNPVMPGVCMLQIIKELTESELKRKLFLKSASNIKFMALINPDVNPELQLLIEISEEGGLFKIKNITSFKDTVALKLNASFKVWDQTEARHT